MLVRVEVHATQLYSIMSDTEGEMAENKYLESSFFDELDAYVELPKFVMAPTRISEYLDAVEAHEDMRATQSTKVRKRRVIFCLTVKVKTLWVTSRV